MRLVEEFLTAVYAMKQRQSESALSGGGYKWPTTINITVRTYPDMGPSCTAKWGERESEGGFESVLEQATKWLHEK
jgi:hypothetical protein